MTKGAITENIPGIESVLCRWEAERELEPDQRLAVYISTPITSGKRFIQWRTGPGRQFNPGTAEYDRAHRAEVVLPNTQDAARFIELLRWRQGGLIIDPTAFSVEGWQQRTYHEFWMRVLERHVRRVILRDGWEFSAGCSLEFKKAQELELDCVDERLRPITRSDGLQLLESAATQAEDLGLHLSHIDDVVEALSSSVTVQVGAHRVLYKDKTLEHLAHTANVAQFVSFGPGPNPEQRYARIRGMNPNHKFSTIEEAVSAMLAHSPEGRVNIRSFDPERPEGNPFIRDQTSPTEVLRCVRELASARGLYSIVNEAIDEGDGGVSGVSYRGLIEFAPDATPRCVDDPEKETCGLPFELGMRFLRSVYGFEPDLRGREGARVEFSIHPQPRGWLQAHTIIWQLEQRPGPDYHSVTQWPNDMSRFVGDKAFGLAVAAAAGLPVPRTLVVMDRLFPWSFGRATGSGEIWTRCCPAIKVPGLYPTVRGWHDPVAALGDPWILDPTSRPTVPNAVPVVSVLVQEAVHSDYSGRTKTSADTLLIHGVPGAGDKFMRGEEAEVALPSHVEDAIRTLHQRAASHFGVVDLEWVYDGATAWIVQMNAPVRPVAPDAGADRVTRWVEFLFEPGRIEEFRHAVAELQGTDAGIVVIGKNISPLSHLGEIAEIHDVPARFVRAQRQSVAGTLFNP